MFSERISRLQGSLVREILAVANQPDVISFAGGLPAPQAMPKLDFTELPASLSQYGPSEGELWLREAVAAEMSKNGVPVNANDILILTGSQQGLDLAAKLFVDNDTPVLVEAPTFLAAVQCFSLYGAKFIEVGLTAHGPDLELLERKLREEKPRFAYLIPTFQNPSGVCYDEATRQRVADLFDEHNVVLLEDEPYRELVYDQCDRAPICSRLKRAAWIHFGTFSKTAIPGLRVAYLACHPSLMQNLYKLKQAADLHTNRQGQWAMHQLLTSADYPAHIARLREFYHQKRDIMAQALDKHFHDIADWAVPPGGLFFWVKLKANIDSYALLEPALAHKVAFMPGKPFYANERISNELRLNFSHASPERIDEGIKTLANVVRAHL
ncbi:aminotransferase-like domain-containing protein [Chitinimonas sp. BJB300]|uniref:aminotransferase-like domain-containing protein n=1 Tax=Chitinimonas sp. BJB300 TaxID=1559339 RepID=UPI000C0D4F22|nr:PLP-dependent aminotransferase family protein [Chitinimonas sp. BJB300]PHV10839.1 GntR family transcriptional regulator [Chitinimonas sp. BJB300]TSJ87048.1 PLP-dependent aminotransferase family protein [Chitinimonas sp. BJB300]